MITKPPDALVKYLGQWYKFGRRGGVLVWGLDEWRLTPVEKVLIESKNPGTAFGVSNGRLHILIPEVNTFLNGHSVSSGQRFGNLQRAANTNHESQIWHQ